MVFSPSRVDTVVALEFRAPAQCAARSLHLPSHARNARHSIQFYSRNGFQYLCHPDPSWSGAVFSPSWVDTVVALEFRAPVQCAARSLHLPSHARSARLSIQFYSRNGFQYLCHPDPSWSGAVFSPSWVDTVVALEFRAPVQCAARSLHLPSHARSARLSIQFYSRNGFLYLCQLDPSWSGAVFSPSRVDTVVYLEL